MSARELLEKAAMADGRYIPSENTPWIGLDDRGLYTDSSQDGTRPVYWNPLTDDGDAFRLVVKLRLRVDCYDDQVETMDGCEPYKIAQHTFHNTFVKIEAVDEFATEEERCAATRLTIVRAAAALADKATS